MTDAAPGIAAPPQVPPVRRPSLVQPHECVDTRTGSIVTLLTIRMELMHGANYNDPGAWAPISYDDRKLQR